MKTIYLYILLILTYFISVYSFASWFAEEYCETPLEVGSIIMNHESKHSTERNIEIYRNVQSNILINNNTNYIPGETLSVVLNGNDIGEMILESNVGLYEHGSCNGKRSIHNTNMNIPLDFHEDIIIWGGWATGHNTVWISSKFVLKSGTGLDKTNVNVNSNSNSNSNTESKPGEGSKHVHKTHHHDQDQDHNLKNNEIKENNKNNANVHNNAHKPHQLHSRYQEQTRQRNIDLEREREEMQTKRYSDLLYEWKELHKSTKMITITLLILCIIAIVFIVVYYRIRISNMLTEKRAQQ